MGVVGVLLWVDYWWWWLFCFEFWVWCWIVRVWLVGFLFIVVGMFLNVWCYRFLVLVWCLVFVCVLLIDELFVVGCGICLCWSLLSMDLVWLFVGVIWLVVCVVWRVLLSWFWWIVGLGLDIVCWWGLWFGVWCLDLLWVFCFCCVGGCGLLWYWYGRFVWWLLWFFWGLLVMLGCWFWWWWGWWVWWWWWCLFVLFFSIVLFCIVVGVVYYVILVIGCVMVISSSVWWFVWLCIDCSLFLVRCMLLS